MKGLNLFSVIVLTLTIMLVPLISMQKEGSVKPTAAGFVSMPETASSASCQELQTPSQKER